MLLLWWVGCVARGTPVSRESGSAELYRNSMERWYDTLYPPGGMKAYPTNARHTKVRVSTVSIVLLEAPSKVRTER